ncbi:hypothetical protein Aple_017820 [Acrocarpospora pleiomorpha]|uniref:Uncharacterized protein n=1 Tax=Acrocarpospora pleiomorpha TaxID=90975 RepID=A0A5M3XB30_9ACTN|nr:hypothetical protein [Acrocarpospora pleiomorpha]GES18887.1 hypothetical protein Aple_017820 [Acrocarpospora pleiomorpha]
MRETGRGALVGLAVGAVQAAMWAASAPWDGHSGVRGPHSLGITLAAFLIGSGVAALVRLRRWPLVALTGAIATLALSNALWKIAPETTFYGFDRSLLGGVHLISALAGFTVAAWALAPTRRWWSRIASLGVLTAVCVLAVPLEEPAQQWHLARAFELLGVPLVAPDIAGHGLYAAEAPSVGRGEPVILLEYRRTGAEHVGGSRLAIQVIVRRASTATTAEACATPHYADSWKNENGPPCRAATRNRWVRYGWEGRIAVFTHSGGALVELESHGVDETTLLTAAETIRPTSAETLAKQVHPVR